jgi:ketosteroid isomerase-like protein
VHLDIPAIRGTYDGTLDTSGREIVGTITQMMSTPLNFTRVDKLDAPPTFSEKENADVRALVAEYFRAFTAKDFDAFRAVFQPPYMMWSVGGSPNTFATLDDIVARYRGLRQSLDATDYAVSKAARMIVTPLSANTAMVDVHWRRDKKDGSLFGEGGEVLMVIRTPAGWKINANLNRQLSQYGKTF